MGTWRENDEETVSRVSHRLPEPGDVIAGKYAVESLLGRGGMGAVYVVTHQLTGKRLALKCLLPEHNQDTDIVQRFMREAQAAGRIQHRHVVDVFDVGQDGSLLYMVMPLLEGKPLSALLQDEELTLEEMLGIMVRAMEGVSAAHAQGIVHRDLKPDNIFVCVGPSGRLDDPRVLDFGISKQGDDLSRPLTRSGVMMGTPYYMSFEQINSQRDLDQRVDVYAMGVILYEAIAGVLPHVAESIGQLAIRMMGTTPPHLAELRPDLPTGLGDVVMKAIARDREDRYPTMQAFVDALKPYYTQGRSSLVPDGQGTPLRAGRPSFSPGPNGSSNMPTVPMRSPVPDLLATSRGGGTGAHNPVTPPPRTLRGTGAEQAPPRVIEAPGNGRWLVGVALVAAAVALLVWLFGPQASSPSAIAEKAPISPQGEAKAAGKERPPQEDAPAVQEGAGEPVAVQAGDNVRPKKKKKVRRRRRRATGAQQPASPQPNKSVVLFVEEDDPNAWEEEEIEVEEGEELPDDQPVEDSVPAGERVAPSKAEPSAPEAQPAPAASAESTHAEEKSVGTDKLPAKAP